MRSYKLKYCLLWILVCCIASCSKDDTNSESEALPGAFSGTIAWLQTVGGTQEDTAQAVAITSDGGFAMAGFTKSINGDISDNTTEQNDYWVVRFSADGTLLWSKTYGGSSDDRAEAIAATNDGGFIISGYSRSSDEDVNQNNGFYDQWIVKLDAGGNIQWEKSFGYSGSDQAFDVIQTQDGGYFTTGFLDITAANGQGNFGRPGNGNPEHGVGEYWCHKLDSNGNLEWSRYFGGTNNDRSYAALQNDNGEFLLAGSSESDDFDITQSKGSYDFWVVKLSNSGELIWQKSYGGTGIDIAYDIEKTQDGNYIVVGDTRSNDGNVSELKGSADFWVLKISDNDGSLLWEQTYGGNDFESARAVTSLQNGGFAITGTAKSASDDVSANNGQNDIWVIRISDNGTLQWEKNIGGSQLDVAYGIVETDMQELIVVGNTQSNDGDILENKGIKDAVILKIE